MNASSHERPKLAPPSSLPLKLTSAPITDSNPPITIKTTGSPRQADKSIGGGRCVVSWRLMSFQIGGLRGRQIVRRSQPAQLQRAQICNDSPAIFCRDQRAGRAHQTFAVSDGVENLAVGQLDDALVMQVRHGGHDAEFFGDAIAVTSSAVARRAINVETLASALKQRRIHHPVSYTHLRAHE